MCEAFGVSTECSSFMFQTYPYPQSQLPTFGMVERWKLEIRFSEVGCLQMVQYTLLSANVTNHIHIQLSKLKLFNDKLKTREFLKELSAEYDTMNVLICIFEYRSVGNEKKKKQFPPKRRIYNHWNFRMTSLSQSHIPMLESI